MENSEKGRSMLEMLGVLAVVGVLSLAGLAGYQKAMAKHKMNRTVSQMAQIVNNMRTVFLNAENARYPYQYFGPTKEDAKTIDGMKKAVALHIFPDEMVLDKSTPIVSSPYRGDVYILTEDQGETFDVVFEGLPRDASIAIGTMDWGTSDITGLQELLINDDAEETTAGIQ